MVNICGLGRRDVWVAEEGDLAMVIFNSIG